MTTPRQQLGAVRRTIRDRAGHAGRVRAVLASGLFDQEWFEAQMAETYDDPAAAAAAYLTTGPGVSPHPLFEHDWIDPERTRIPEDESPLLWYLADPKRRETLSPHPLIDLPRLVRGLGDAERHPGGPVSTWAASARPGTRLPTPAGLPELTWGEFRERALAAVGAFIASRDIKHAPRLSGSLPDDFPPTTSGTRPGAGRGLEPGAGRPTPLVSVVLPTWNRAQALRQAIESVQAQSFDDWELIVVDDGSTDDTEQVVTGIAAYEDRLVHVPVPHHGVCRARNEGIARARGRYVAFLDSDNTWNPDFLGTMVDVLEANGWAMAHSAIRLRRADGEIFYRAFEGTHDHLLVRNHVDLNVLVVRRDALQEIGGFDESLRRAVDYDLALRLAARHDLHLVPFVGAEYSDGEADTDPDRISNREPSTWISVALGKHLVDWDAVTATEPTPGLVSIVLAVRGNAGGVLEWFRSLRESADLPVELVIMGVRIRRSLDTLIHVLCSLHPSARYSFVVSDVNNAVAQNIGVAHSRGERVVLVQSQTVRPDVPALVRLATPLDDPEVALVQPVVVDAHGLVVTAGAVFGPGRAVRPVPFLAGHAHRDAQAADGVALPSALGPVVAARAETLARIRGVDALVGDGLAELELGLRTAAEGLGRTVLASDVRLTFLRPALPLRKRLLEAVPVLESRYDAPPAGSIAAWRAAGFDVVGHRHDLVSRESGPLGPKDVPLPVAHPLVVPHREVGVVTESAPALRWVIDLASPAGPKGEAWGDTHFARSLARALERLGQRVAIDPRQARHRASRDLDDVMLVVRGLDEVSPRPGLAAIEWIISHPDLVSAHEMASFDAVFAASLSWSAEATTRTGVRVEPLLQCTDPELFRPAPELDGTGPEVLFVGNSRGIYRSAVRNAIAVGAPLTIHGAGWEPFVDAEVVASSYVANTELGALYSSAGVVLNDHWEDMRRDGFVSNRLFDAAASGARVVSDEVAGLSELFGALVQPYRDEEDVRRLVAERATAFPDAEARRTIAERVAAHHSFDARAATLVDTAARLVADRHRDPSRA